MENALIGYSGFVGTTLLQQFVFNSLYRSTNIASISGRNFDTVVCAGAPAQKWIANREPSNDLENINKIIDSLKTVKCKTFILISTVDVFHTPIKVDESTRVDETNLHPYGLNRRVLEKFVENHFDNPLIVRLPGLVGSGLKKNIIFDFKNNNNLNMIESRNVFQFYPMINLWNDISIALKNKLQLIHLASEPICVSKIASDGFGIEFCNHLGGNIIEYDMRTRHADIFGKSGYYQYNAIETIESVRSYAQSQQ